MPTRVEIDLNPAIPVWPFQIVVQTVDAERVPISECNLSTRPVPRSQWLATADFHQQPAASFRTETTDSQQKPIIARFAGLPKLAFPSDRRSQGSAAFWLLQVEGSTPSTDDVGGSVPEKNDDAGVPDRDNDPRRLFFDLATIVGLSLDRGTPVTCDGNYRQGD
ncbi:MAG TPA: hypothetical protein VK575_03260 [Gemmatimonadaceae bacterium]|nr:hypothetical protein [Gemmatimonadaceae bacterium]